MPENWKNPLNLPYHKTKRHPATQKSTYPNHIKPTPQTPKTQTQTQTRSLQNQNYNATHRILTKKFKSIYTKLTNKPNTQPTKPSISQISQTTKPTSTKGQINKHQQTKQPKPKPRNTQTEKPKTTTIRNSVCTIVPINQTQTANPQQITKPKTSNTKPTKKNNKPANIQP